MDKEMLIKRLEETNSLVDFYDHKEEILCHLKGKGSAKAQKRRAELNKLSMNDLREVGDELGAKDNSKKELIEEIIEKEGL